ncbi:Na+ dependent nucleoside transporter N-terminal domain-containing protein, partial [Enterococcus faecalis]|uniref:Na+ dependent nucleoside transporter N-terminal domain-containing protein n=1 Tax=Enterococcus faecalis TaxID=1351 RepID=UPI00403F4F30
MLPEQTQRLLIGLAGIVVILGVAVLFSTNRRAIRLRVVVPAFALPAGLAALVLRFPPGKVALQGAAGGVESLLGYARAGVAFAFGPLASPEIGGHSFVISALPTIVFFAAL